MPQRRIKLGERGSTRHYRACHANASVLVLIRDAGDLSLYELRELLAPELRELTIARAP